MAYIDAVSLVESPCTLCGHYDGYRLGGIRSLVQKRRDTRQPVDPSLQLRIDPPQQIHSLFKALFERQVENRLMVRYAIAQRSQRLNALLDYLPLKSLRTVGKGIDEVPPEKLLVRFAKNGVPDPKGH